MKLRKLQTCLALMLLSYGASAEDVMWSRESRTIQVHSLTSENGLSHTRIRAAYRDESGFLWVGTDDGLNRYDGNRVEIFRPKGEGTISTNLITRLCGDGDGHLFFTGRQSLSMLDFRNMRFTVLQENGIRAMTFDAGTLYYAMGNDVYSYDVTDNGHRLVFSYMQKSDEIITDICVDTHGTIYLALNNDEILKISRDRFISRYNFTSLHNITTDNDGNVWLSSRSEGFSVIRPDGSKRDFRIGGDTAHALDWNNVRNIVKVDRHKYFIGTYAGLALLDTETWKLTPYDYESGLSGFNSKAVSNLHFRDGILFIGTFHAGLHYYIRDNDVYKTYGPSRQDNTGITSPIVSSIVKDKRDVLWIGTVSGGLNIVDPEEKISPRLKGLLKEEFLTNIKYLYYDEEEDAVYACLFSEGICRIDIKNSLMKKASPIFTDSNTGRTFVSQNITQLIPLDKRYCLALSLDGVVKLDRQKMTLESLVTPAPSGMLIKSIALDSGHNLWFATESSLTQMNLDNPEIYRYWPLKEIHGVSDEIFITTVFLDKEERIWLGTSGAGVFLWDEEDKCFKNCQINDSLTNGYINDMVQSRISDIIYMATNEGFASFDPTAGTHDNHNMSKGIPLTITDRLYASRDSILYACDITGITAIEENSLHSRYKDYRIYVKDIYINNSSESGYDSPLKSSMLYQDSIELHGTISTLSFDIVNSSLDPLLTTAFEYRLEGFDDRFTTARGNQIRYTNIGTGRYTLVIRGTIPQSNGEFPETRIAINVYPPFYRSWWFISLALFICLAIALVLILSYLRAARLRVLLDVEKREKELEKKLSSAKSSFLTDISHEFRTPLTLINSHMEIMMQKSSLDPEIYSNLVGAYKNTRKLREMIDEFIDINRADTAEMHMNPSPRSVNDIANEIYLLFQDYAQSRGLSYTFVSCDENPWASVDYSHISRAVTNLVSNAFKYTKDSIDITVGCTADKVMISVRDNGIGIEKNNLEKIFERFFQEERANRTVQTKGSGIGLAYAHDIVSRHGGELSVESTPEVSTTFTICLDRCRIPEDGLKGHVTFIGEVSEHDLSDFPYEETTILLVEDNEDILDVMVSIFARYSVITACNGEEGLEKATRHLPDLIISDVMMPGMSGTEMCRLLKSNFATSHIPIILLTALGTESHTLDGLAQGADDYITKPFNSRILLARCNNMIRSRKALHDRYAHNASESETVLTENPIDAKLLKEAIAIIESNINENDFDILFFARQLCLSRTQLFKKIKSLTGMTPNMFVLSIKLKRASQEILANPDENIAEIAYRCGFNTPSYFIKCFRKFYGMTPLTFRKNNR